MSQKGWHQRGYLPHIDARGVTQFITIRLFDAVPQPLLLRWKEELRLRAPSNPSLISEEDENQLARQIARFEDQGHGSCFLGKAEVASLVQEMLIDSLDGLISWVIMPNHLHFLVQTPPEPSLGLILKNLKGATAHKANQALRRSGRFWFPDYFDRVIRNDQHLRRARYYIEQNPVKAGLAKRAEDWRFGSAFAPQDHSDGAD